MARILLAVVAGSVLATSVGLPWAYWRSVEPWALEGFAMTFCPCGTPCPCRSGGASTHGSCTAATFVEVTEGHYGATSLDGLRFVAVGDMHARSWRVVYIAKDVAASRRKAMLAIGENMLLPRRFFAPLLRWVGGPAVEVREVVRIDYSRDALGVERWVSIPDILDLHGRLRAKADGTPTDRTPALDELSNWIAYADNLAYRYHDPATQRPFDFTGRQANFKTFRLTKSDYDAERLLFQHAARGDSRALASRLAELRSSDEVDSGPLMH